MASKKFSKRKKIQRFSKRFFFTKEKNTERERFCSSCGIQFHRLGFLVHYIFSENITSCEIIDIQIIHT